MATERVDIRPKVIERACNDFSSCKPVNAELLTDREFCMFADSIFPLPIKLNEIMVPFAQRIREKIDFAFNKINHTYAGTSRS